MTSSFADLGVPTDIARALRDAGIDTPFPIQELTLRHALAGRDLCGKAPTGSGKTLAFALPVAVRAGRAKPHRPTALILTPTRELAAQIRRTLLPLAKVRDLRVATIYGGTNIKTDVQALRKGVDIAVATPGRLADLVRRGDIALGAVELVVLDEADRMADMGFLPEVKRLLDQTSDSRQTLLFSATLDGDVDVLIKRYQDDPVTIEVDTPAEEVGDVRHLFWAADRGDRRAITAEIVRHVSPAIVFTRTKRGADRLAKQLSADGIAAEAIHGNRSQNQRDRALSNFQRGRSTTLVATDVAARGIHVDDVAVVVHYDPASTDKDYVHRSGRTGRAGNTGVVVSLVTDEDHAAVATFQRILDLPLGLHERDHAHLTAADTPAPTLATDSLGNGGPRPTTRAGDGGGDRNGGNRTGGNRSGGNRTGGNPRSKSGSSSHGGARKRATSSRGKGGSRQRSAGRS